LLTLQLLTLQHLLQKGKHVALQQLVEQQLKLVPVAQQGLLMQHAQPCLLNLRLVYQGHSQHHQQLRQETWQEWGPLLLCVQSLVCRSVFRQGALSGFFDLWSSTLFLYKSSHTVTQCTRYCTNGVAMHNDSELSHSDGVMQRGLYHLKL